MPVTAKLSRDFYEHFGDKIVDELVGLLNLVDATYRAELREQNELNFARFEAKLDQRLAELRAELKQDIAELGKRLDLVENKLDKRLDLADSKLDIGIAGLKLSLEQTLREQTRWFVAAWGTLIVAWAAVVALNIGLWTRLP